MLTTIVSFIIVLGVLIFVHEFGHYITAKKSGIRVEEFALGFGPRLISRKKGETVYSLRLIPLGGFCNLTGEFPPDDDAEPQEIEIYNQAKEEGRCFHQKSMFKRFAVLFMGPFMNFLLAVLIFILVFMIFGLPMATSDEPVIGELDPSKPAAESGLKAGDRIVAINGVEVESWEGMAELIREEVGETITIEYIRDKSRNTAEVVPEYSEDVDGGIIGIFPGVIRERVGPLRAIRLGIVQTWQVIHLTIGGFIQMISQRSAAEIGGPIMIASIIGQAAQVGVSNLLNWTAIISINLGIINLLPFPALDGGRILFIIFELIRGKPVPPEKEGFVHLVGFIILMILMVMIIYKDIMQALF